MPESEAGEPADSAAPVGFIGLGNIGAPMARRLLGWPGGLVVFDVSTVAADELAAKGARVAASAAEVTEHCDVVCVMVNTEDQVRRVLEGPEGILAGSARRDLSARPVVAVHSTISPQGAADLARVAAERGVDLLDAAVSGGAMGAHEGTLAFMVGGDTAAFERCREVFAAMASLVRHFGPVGAGTRAKVTRNLITFVSFVAVGEASRIAEAGGLDLVALGEVVRHSDQVTGGPGAVMMRDTAARLGADDPLRPVLEHTASLGEKDLELALAAAEELGIEVPVARAAAQRLRHELGLDP